MRAHLLDARPQRVLARGRQRARDHVGMAVEIFGRRMHHDVGAERERPREHRRRGGGIDGEQRARRVRDLGDGRDVGDAPQRIGGRLDPDEFRVGLDRGAHRVEVRHVDEIDAIAEQRRLVHQPVAQAPVADLRREHVRARRQRKHHAGRRRHAGAEQQRLVRAFERGDHGLGLAHGRVVGPAVAVAGAILVVGIADEGGRDMHRQRDRPGRGVDCAERLRRDRARLERALRICRPCPEKSPGPITSDRRRLVKSPRTTRYAGRAAVTGMHDGERPLRLTRFRSRSARSRSCSCSASST